MTKEQVLSLLQIAKQYGKPETVGGLIGMALIDSFLPKTKLDPDWDVEELKTFCVENGLEMKMSIAEAIEKIT